MRKFKKKQNFRYVHLAFMPATCRKKLSSGLRIIPKLVYSRICMQAPECMHSTLFPTYLKSSNLTAIHQSWFHSIFVLLPLFGPVLNEFLIYFTVLYRLEWGSWITESRGYKLNYWRREPSSYSYAQYLTCLILCYRIGVCVNIWEI